MLHAIQETKGRPLSIRAFAEAAETSPRRIRRLIRQGRLRTLENQAGEVRIPETELDRLSKWKDRRRLSHSMEMTAVSMERSAVSMEMEPSRTTLRAVRRDDPIAETYAMQIPLPRHEAAMMRIGYLESELAVCRRMLEEGKDRETLLRDNVLEEQDRSHLAETRLEEIQDKLVMTEFKLEEMRSQVIESSFQAVKLQEEVKELRDRLMSSWFSRALEVWRMKKSSS